MKGIRVVVNGILAFYAVMYALDYVESSTGLQNPQFESGRTEVEMVDINGDGNTDILCIGDHGSPYINTQEHGIMVWFGDGSGIWNVYQNGNFGYGGIAVGDLNNDGYLDVGYGMHHNYSGTDFGDSILEAALGDGSGQVWQAWDDGISIGNPNQWGMFCTDLADIDNDGFLDLGANSFGYGDGIHIFLNNGDGTWTGCFGFIGGNSTMDFCFGDVNADGNADFAAGHQYGSIYLGDGAGNFALADGNLPPGGSMGRRGPALGDIDNDGDQDFAFCNSSGGVQIWTWQGNNTWANASGTLPSSGPYEVAQLFDMNIDGFMDVVAFGDGTTSVWLGSGAGNWVLDATFATPSPGYYSAFRVGADADHNGYPDLAMVVKEGDYWTAYNHLRFFKESSIPESLFVFPLYPRGGERFRPGSVRYIRWTCAVPNGEALLKLELSIAGLAGPWSCIVDSVANNGLYQWAVPESINSDQCYIRYTAVALTDTSICITPGAFTIATGTGVDDVPLYGFSISPGLVVSPSISKYEFSIGLSVDTPDKRRLSVHDASGSLIRDLLTVYGAGRFIVPWDRRDNNGRPAPAGIYFVTLSGGRNRISQKVVVVD